MIRVLTIPTILLIVWFVTMIVGAIFSVSGLKNGSYVAYVSQKKMIFRRPLALRVGAALFGFDMIQTPFVFSVAAGDWAAFVFLVIPCTFVGGLFLRGSGPDELRLDLVQRTYRRVSGWPLFPKARSGPWTDIQGIYVGSVAGASGSTRFVGVTGMRLGGRQDLGRFNAPPAAEHFADKLASDLGLPRIRPPRPLVSAR